MTPAGDDTLLPFQIETQAARGRLVRLGALAQDVLERHDYPDAVAGQLAELMVLATLISGALKFDGIMTVQIKGDGAINMMVCDITSEGGMRGFAQFDADLIEKAAASLSGPGAREPVPALFGSGYMAFTVDQGPDTDRYQGIVDLNGPTLADCAHRYFRQSEQLEAVVKVAAGRVVGDDGAPEAAGRWRAGGLMVQKMPPMGLVLQSGDHADEDFEDAWRRAIVLMSSATDEELISPDLPPNDLLFRLFHEDGVRVFDGLDLVKECRCSESRVIGMLQSFPREEIETMKVDGDVVVTCEFCSETYRFDEAALNEVYSA